MSQRHTSETAAPAPLLSLRGITKRFPGVLANDGIDLDVHRGEIHALLGENGAGKTTLMKIVYGFYRPDAGTIRLDGEPVEMRSPHEARRRGIGMLFQNFTLVPAFTVAENVALFRSDMPALVDRRRIARELGALAGRYGLGVDAAAVVGRLSAGQQQKVEILKVLLGGARLLIFDEPTSVLAPHEVEGLFAIFRRLRDDGYVIVFITHKLREVRACADRITVLRRGRVAGTAGPGASEGDLVALMFGTAPPELRREPARAPIDGVPALELGGLETETSGESAGLAGIDLVVRRGEIVGVAGVAGNGQEELGDVILGVRRVVSGRKLLFGREATRWSVAEVRASGVAFIPESPLLMAVVPSMTPTENMALAAARAYSRLGGLAVDWAAARSDLERGFAALGVTDPSLDVPTATLSGGNVQRLAFAREMARDPRLVVALYPTRGLDVTSAAAAQEQLLAARSRGAGVLLISQDLEELFALADRIVVLYRGRAVGTFRPAEASAHEVGRLMTGGTD